MNYKTALEYFNNGKFADADKLLRGMTDKDKDVLMLRGLVKSKLGDSLQAVEFLSQAVKISPGDPRCHFNLGIVLEKSGQKDAAVRSYIKAVELSPDYIPAMNNLAGIYKHSGRLLEAEAICRKCIDSNPERYEPYSTLGNLLVSARRHDEAIGFYRKALAINPDCAKTHSNLLLCLNYCDNASSEEIFREHLEWGRALAAKFYKPGEYANARTSDKKLRIGYVSADFKRHSVAFFIEPVIHWHNKEKFEIFCYSDVGAPDAITARIKSMAFAWRDICEMSHEDVASIVRDDKIDILVDLGGHTCERMPLFAIKPAPLQAAYLGYLNTTGLETVDYRITDEWSDPPGQEQYHTEKIVRISGGMQAYSPPADAPDTGAPPFERNGYFTFGSFNNLSKITGEVIRIWALILNKVPNSKLLLKGRSLADPSIRNALLEEFASNGVSSERLILKHFAPTLSEHLNIYNQVDLSLDTFPHNGVTTVCEAMWMGTPVLTLAGERHASRAASSIIARVGLESFIARSVEEYIAKAEFHGRNPETLANLRPALRGALMSSSLCDGEGLTLKLERFYRKAWQDYIDRAAKSSMSSRGNNI